MADGQATVTDSIGSRRVLHVATTYGLPSETFIVDAIASAEEAGWEGWLAALEIQNRSRFPFPPDDRVIVPSFSVLRRARDRLLRPSLSERFAHAALVRASTARPAVVHAHFGWAALYALPLARLLGVPLVCTFHASDVTVMPEPPLRPGEPSPTYAELFRHLDLALAVSNFTAQVLRDIGWTGPTEIVPAGVRLDQFPSRDEVAGPPGRLRLLFVGRLVERKGLDVLLRATARLVQTHPDLALDIIGDGALRADHEQLSAELGLQHAVTFLGGRGPADVADALRRSHIMVMPSRAMPSGEVEGSPVVLKEALAVGVPTVATRTGGTEEVIPPPLRDELVPSDDPAALAQRIDAVIADRPNWPERVRVGQAWVAAEFDWSVLGRRTAQIYERLARGA